MQLKGTPSGGNVRLVIPVTPVTGSAPVNIVWTKVPPNVTVAPASGAIWREQ